MTLMLASSISAASTFVGNGGNAGDMELEVAIREMKEVFLNRTNYSHKLCTCNEEFQSHGTCDILNALSKEQVQYCAQFIEKNAGAALALLTDRQKVKYRWTQDEMTVVEKSGERTADAVANTRNMEITLQQNRFLQLRSYERIFLLTHEMFHLVNINGKQIQDEEKIGPFQTSDGGRQLLNAVGAATVMMAHEQGVINKYQGTLKRSQAHKKHWLSLVLNSSQSSGDSSYAVQKRSGASLGYRHMFGDWGFIFEYRSAHGEQSVGQTIKGVEDQSAFSAGLAYRLFPYRDPMTFTGQSHFLLAAQIETMKSAYNLKDNFISLNDNRASTGWTAGCSYFMPLQSNFWFYGQVRYIAHNYTYDFGALKFDVSKPQTNLGLGMSYAF